MKKAATYPAGNSLQDAADSLLVSINTLFCAIKFPVQISSQPVCMEKNGRITSLWGCMYLGMHVFGDACLWGCMILSPGAKSEPNFSGATFRPSLR
jgi:hypothetical protein